VNPAVKLRVSQKVEYSDHHSYTILKKGSVPWSSGVITFLHSRESACILGPNNQFLFIFKFFQFMLVSFTFG
jgi:hypothetical protein